ncbi:MAG: GNAT family N-acetyltransferase [Solirubrobacteraceae bacterium]
MRKSDSTLVRAFLERISAEAMQYRFFAAPNLDWVAEWSVDVDYTDQLALVALTGEPARIVAHAAYIRSSQTKAEVAFLVADDFQGHGIATTLLAHLAVAAERHGITTFTAEVLPANHKMVETFRESGFPVDIRSSPQSLEIELPTSVTPEARARFEERERIAAVAAVQSFLEPQAVALVGASRQPGTPGREILRNILSSGFNGPVYAVNPTADTIEGLPCYPSVSAIPDAVELAVVVVPATEVIEVARDCAQAGVRALVVISSGFAEAGPQGAARQRQLLEVCRTAGIRIVGPNCLGVINTDPAINLNTTFAPRPALPGSVGFMSQSGGLGIAIIEAASRLTLGLSSFVAVGNKADLSGNDMLSYWEQDERTRVAMLYLESFGNPRKFARIAPRFARRKPLLAVKSGRSAAGARATSSHTGTLLAESDVTIDALFDQAGVIRTDTLHELFAVAQLLTSQPVPRGDRVAIVSNAGGPAIMCADACQADGVEVPELPPVLQRKLAELLPPGASVSNPIDMLGGCRADHYDQTIRELADADVCDAILVIFVPSLTAQANDVAGAVRGAAEVADGIALAAVFMTQAPPPAELSDGAIRVPGYEFPEDAARAVALAARHGRWRARSTPQPMSLDGVYPERAAAVIADALGHGEDLLGADFTAQLLDCYGIPPVSTPVPKDAIELVVGVINDTNFGPVLACRPGGTTGELTRDVAVRLTPLSALDAHELPRQLHTFPLMDGYGEAPRCDVSSFEELLLRISAAVENHREIVAFDCAPVYVSPQGTALGGARIRVRSAAPPPPTPSLLGY